MRLPQVSSRHSVARVRVRYAETDKMGVVYYANYLVWFEVGRCEWLRQGGFTYAGLEREGTVLPVIGAQCEYRRPAHYDDDIEVRTKASVVSPVRLRFDYEIWRAGGDLLAEGWTEHAAVDPEGRLRRLPAHLRSLFT
ncbi:MAG TPA: thioesterase family protein [Vicinamibacterales bacterium]|nr:thioesterase family protein [Vicinamibacterales bacterium]